MPVDLVHVFSVTSGGTTQAGVSQFVILAMKVTRPDMGLQLQTVNPYAAAVCQQGKDQQRAVAVTWERTKYGATLQAAHLITVKGAA